MSARARLGGASPLANKIPSLRHEVGPCAGPCTATRARTGFQRVCTGPGCFRHHMVSFRHRSRSAFTSRPLGGAISGLRSPSPLGGDERPPPALSKCCLAPLSPRSYSRPAIALDAVDGRVWRVLVAICASVPASTSIGAGNSSAIAHARGPLVGSD